MAKRTKIKTEWDLSLILPKADKKTVEKEMRQIERATDTFVKKWKGRKDWLSKPAALKRALDDYESWYKKYSKGGAAEYYYSLATSINLSDASLKAMSDKLLEFSVGETKKIRFFKHRLSQTPKKTQEKFLSAAVLADYKNNLKETFAYGPHRLSEDAEHVMSVLAGPAYGNWRRMQSDLVSREERFVKISGKKIKKNLSNLLSDLQDQNKNARDAAAHAIDDILLNNADVAEAELNTILQVKKIEDAIRGFNRPDEERHLVDDIDQQIIETLINAVSDHYFLPAKYYRLKAQILGQSKLEFHERMVSHGTVRQRFTYAAGIDVLKKVFGTLDSEFLSIFSSFIERGQIDVYPRKGKRGGGFCTGHRSIDPIFILLNWNDTPYDVRVLAHEMGHAFNFEFSRRHQNSLNFGSSLAIAEVPSTFFEDFVYEAVMDKVDDEARLIMLIDKIENDIASIHRQIAAYQLELELHNTYREKGYLSKEEIGKMFSKHMKSYMGPHVRQTPGSENWWVYWSHLRMSFYVYSYASGQIISKALQRRIKKDPKEIEDFKKLLAAGTSDTPENIFKSIGIDITKKSFWEEGLKEVEELYDEIYTLAKKLKKI